MIQRRTFFPAFALVAFFFAGILVMQSSNPAVVTAPVYVPNMSHANGPMPDGVLSWNSAMMKTNLPANTAQAHFLFSFTNVVEQVNKTLVTNIVTRTYLVPSHSLASPRNKPIFPPTRSVTVTNIYWVTNSISGAPVTITDVHPSCGCTTAQLPRLPWTIPPGGSGQIPITVNIFGRTGTFFKSVQVTTDRGGKQLLLEINVQPPAARTMTPAERSRDISVAKLDRQAIFRGDCASCHVQDGQGKYGQALFQADCAICHEAQHRASFVPDLHDLKVPTNTDFWQTWISYGKPGSFMPAFSQSSGGPLTDMQIASLAVYLNTAIPSKVPPAPQ